MFRILPFIFLFIACSTRTGNKEEIIIVDTLKVSGTIYVHDSIQVVQDYTLYAIYDGQVTIQGPTNSASSKTIQFDSIKIGIPQGHENGVVKFRVKVNGLKETRTWMCYGETPDTFKVNQKVFSNVIINAQSCAYNWWKLL